MKVLILGMDGYIGWGLAMSLAKAGNEVSGVDNFSRRDFVSEMNSQSALPLKSMDERLSSFKAEFGGKIEFCEGDLRDYDFVEDVLKKYEPDSIVHLGEQPSAPYSQIDVKHAAFTQTNNVTGTLNVIFALHKVVPEAHLLKLGTMGEYGTPNIDIAEGFFDIEYKGRKDTLPFPKQPGSWYHCSKVHDTINIALACRIWGIRSTDIMQGVVYGTRTNEIVNESLFTRFDFDEAFGTVINRYCAQAVINHPLTPYGSGKQKRGFIALRDSIQCLKIVLKNPPAEGEYRVFNQFDEVYGIYELAEKVKEAGEKKGLNVKIEPVENPRVEAGEHHYAPEHEKLKALGFKPTRLLKDELATMLGDLMGYKERILEKRECILPKVKWRT